MTVHDLIGILAGAGIGGGICFLIYMVAKLLKWIWRIIW